MAVAYGAGLWSNCVSDCQVRVLLGICKAILEFAHVQRAMLIDFYRARIGTLTQIIPRGLKAEPRAVRSG